MHLSLIIFVPAKLTYLMR